jgi:hypothetical protein
MKQILHRTQLSNTKFIVYYLLVLICCSCNNSKNRTSHYTIRAIINTEQQSLNAKADISYFPPETTNSIEFITHENVRIKNISADGLLDYIEKEKGNKIKTILLNFKNKIENPLKISFEYTFLLKEKDAPWGIDKISENWIELSLNSGWLPIISSYDNQFSSETELSIVSKKEFNILSSGISKVVGNNTFKITNTIPQIDLVLIGSSQFQESRQDNITIYENQENKKRNEFIFKLSEKSYQWLNNTFGNIKTLPPVKLVITPRNESGYARKNFIVLSNDISAKDTLHFVNYITHEFAHYWSTGANPLSEHRWLDESIAEYVAWKYISKNYKETDLKEFLIKAEKEAETIPPVYILGKNKIPSHAVMYRKGVYKLFKLEEMIGEKKMFSLLSDWFKVERKNSEKFLKKIENTSGNKTAEIFRFELSK